MYLMTEYITVNNLEELNVHNFYRLNYRNSINKIINNSKQNEKIINDINFMFDNTPMVILEREYNESELKITRFYNKIRETSHLYGFNYINVTKNIDNGKIVKFDEIIKGRKDIKNYKIIGNHNQTTVKALQILSDMNIFIKSSFYRVLLSECKINTVLPNLLKRLNKFKYLDNIYINNNNSSIDYPLNNNEERISPKLKANIELLKNENNDNLYEIIDKIHNSIDKVSQVSNYKVGDDIFKAIVNNNRYKIHDYDENMKYIYITDPILVMDIEDENFKKFINICNAFGNMYNNINKYVSNLVRKESFYQNVNINTINAYGNNINGIYKVSGLLKRIKGVSYDDISIFNITSDINNLSNQNNMHNDSMINTIRKRLNECKDLPFYSIFTIHKNLIPNANNINKLSLNSNTKESVIKIIEPILIPLFMKEENIVKYNYYLDFFYLKSETTIPFSLISIESYLKEINALKFIYEYLNKLIFKNIDEYI